MQDELFCCDCGRIIKEEDKGICDDCAFERSEHPLEETS